MSRTSPAAADLSGRLGRKSDARSAYWSPRHAATLSVRHVQPASSKDANEAARFDTHEVNSPWVPELHLVRCDRKERGLDTLDVSCDPGCSRQGPAQRPQIHRGSHLQSTTSLSYRPLKKPSTDASGSEVCFQLLVLQPSSEPAPRAWQVDALTGTAILSA